jgi:hypothetical protein
MVKLRELEMLSFNAGLETARVQLSEVSRVLASLPEENHLESLLLNLQFVHCSDYTAFVDLDRELCRENRYDKCQIYILLSFDVIGIHWRTEDPSALIASFTSQLSSPKLPNIHFTTPGFLTIKRTNLTY